MKLFSFTFLQHVRRKGYRIGTFAGILLCFLFPFAGMTLEEHFSGQEEVQICQAGTVYVADQSENPLRDVKTLEHGRDETMAGVSFVLKPDFESAYEQAEKDENALVLVIDESGEAYEVSVIRPKESSLDKSDAGVLEDYVEHHFNAVLMAKTGLNPVQMALQFAELNTPVSVEIRQADGGSDTDASAGENTDASGEENMSAVAGETVDSRTEEAEDPFAEMRKILGMALPYLNIMLLYFLILFYGQSVAACILMEKTSKLMDTLLISVRPVELLLGKVFATVLAAFLQVFSWLLALVGGFAAGTFAVRQMNPKTDMLLIRIFDGLKLFGGMFSVSGFLLGCAIILAGFLLYCSMAAIGGALAGKQEDLSSTSMMYILVLIASFFVTLQSMGEVKLWMNWVPFTAVLVTPAWMLTGDVSFVQGLGSLAVILVTAVLIVSFAGKIYQVMALYKGTVPKPGQILAMLKKQQ